MSFQVRGKSGLRYNQPSHSDTNGDGSESLWGVIRVSTDGETRAVQQTHEMANGYQVAMKCWHCLKGLTHHDSFKPHQPYDTVSPISRWGKGSTVVR